jgi:anti-anti-sigma factor
MTSSPGSDSTDREPAEPHLRSVDEALDGFASDRLLAELARAHGEVSRAEPARVYTIKLTLSGQFAQLRLSGELDAAAAPELTRTLEGLDRIPVTTVHVDMTGVRFLDSSGIRPLVEAERRRRDLGQPPFLIGGISRRARRLFVVSGLGRGHRLDIDGWDAVLSRGAAKRV